MSRTTFTYTPLRSDGRTIRCLSILQSSNFSSTIRINLKEIDLDKDPLPHALSYVWGDPTDTVPIEVTADDSLDSGEFHLLHVTRNCEQALQELRYLSEPRSLWVDAICINQRDLPERGQQVAMMAEIYGKVPGIFAWLGSGSPSPAADVNMDSELRMAIGFLIDVAAQFPGDDFQSFRKAVIWKWSGRWATVIAGMKRIFTHPWWERLWVYQEIVLCREARILLGHGFSIPWGTLVSASEVLIRVAKSPMLWAERPGYLDVESEGDFNLWKSLQSVDFLLPAHRAADRTVVHRGLNFEVPPGLLNQEELVEIEGLLCRGELEALQTRMKVTQSLKCFDPRDRVFALLGSVTAMSKMGIVPDYTKTYHEVYWDFAKVMASFTLEFLCSAGIDLVGTSNNPSWVPDWHLLHLDKTLPKAFSGIYNALGFPDKVSAGLPDIQLQDDGRALCVKGYLIDAVDQILGKPFDSGSEGRQEVFKAFPVDYSDTKQERTKFREERIRNLVRTCTANVDRTGHSLSEETVTTWIKGGFLMIDAYSDKEDEQEDEDEDEDYGDDEDCGSPSSEQLLYDDDDDFGFGGFVEGMTGFKHASKAASEGRKFLQTREGRMALGPGGAVVGDVICVVLHCSMPLVLRQDPGREGVYQLVGACYVHGVMYGEAGRELSDPVDILVG
ncbi:HET-domain-containing protein [Podospora fimiseda]|uniref:HET-domain-containing protein n=1 Tax=Podospora fimiseda TaxID=252190 RepID=A0AAN7BI78_9PEZI|nr:HET-domain-containing protein [Podospora fimiseda]